MAPTPSGRQGPRFRLAFVIPRADPFYDTMRRAMESAAQRLGLAPIASSTPYQWDPSAQTSRLNEAVRGGAEAILIAPAEPTMMLPPVERAIAAGVVVITVDLSLTRAVAVADVAAEQSVGGAAEAAIMGQLIGGRGAVFVVGGAPELANVARR